MIAFCRELVTGFTDTLGRQESNTPNVLLDTSVGDLLFESHAHTCMLLCTGLAVQVFPDERFLAPESLLGGLCWFKNMATRVILTFTYHQRHRGNRTTRLQTEKTNCPQYCRLG